MAKKGLENFTDKVAKDLIKKQSIRDEQRKIREEYLENKYKEASDLTNDIEVYIESLNNIINIKLSSLADKSPSIQKAVFRPPDFCILFIVIL